MIATPLFGLLVDKLGRRALFMIAGSILLMPVYLMMGYSRHHLVMRAVVCRDDGDCIFIDSGGDVAVGSLYRERDGWGRPMP